MKRLFLIVVSISISTGVYYTIRYGLRPKPIPVLNATKFERPEQLGVVIYKRLRTDIRAERVVLLGSSLDVPEDFRVWDGLVKAALADHEKIVYFERTILPVDPVNRKYEVIPYDDAAVANGKLGELVKARQGKGKLILIHGLNREASHLVEQSLVRRLEVLLQHPLLALSILRLAVNATERETLEPACASPGTDLTGQGRLGCAAERVAKQMQRRALDPRNFWSVIERHGLKEYLVFVHPAGESDAKPN